MTSTIAKSANRFCTHHVWSDAAWIATTYRCHPTGAAPPVMGLVFADHEKGMELFANWTNDWGNQDPDDAIRIAVIEGEIPGQIPGYSIRLSADSPDADAGQVQRMHPSPETEASLEEFKAQYLHHGEFLLCPVIQKEDGQLWFDASSGIIKRHVEVRNADDISCDDADAIVLQPTAAETALRELIEAANDASDEGPES